jgi:xanthine dehydrogenase accessory factor
MVATAMRELIPQLTRWQARGQRCALATVVAVHGRAPLPVGATLIVAEDGSTAGAVSGGCVEREVARVAGDVLRGAEPRRLTFAPGAGDDLGGIGLPCGGGIDVWVQPWVAGDRDESGRFADAGVGRESLGDAQARFAAGVLAGTHARLTTEMESPDATFELVVPIMARLVLVGAGLVASAVCTLARGLGYRPIVVDPRETVAAHAPLQDASELLLSWPDEALAKLSPLYPEDAVIVLSHQPALDDAALLAALTSDVGFIGALGSRTAHDDRLTRLRARGLTEPELARIVGPVGLDLGGWSPAEVAVSITGELIAARHGRSGGRLSGADGPIHGALAAGREADRGDERPSVSQWT